MTLREMQSLHVRLVKALIGWTLSQPGHELTAGEWLRGKEQALANAASGAGIARSNHLVSLAIDLRLFINGVYQTDSAAYKAMGDYWKSLHPLARWGGDFHDAHGRPKPDGNHFSLEYLGRK